MSLSVIVTLVKENVSWVVDGYSTLFSAAAKRFAEGLPGDCPPGTMKVGTFPVAALRDGMAKFPGRNSMSLPQFSLKTMIVSIAIGMAAASCYMTLNQDVHPSVLNADFRYAEVDGYFAKFKEGKIIDTVSLPILNDDMEVQIVESVRGADYGFIESRYPLDRFWVQAHGYHVHVYDEHHLFVIVSDRHEYKQTQEKYRAAP